MNKNIIAVAAVAVAIATLAASCEKEQPRTPQQATLLTSYRMTESNSMVTKAHTEIVDAIAALNPQAIPVTAKVQGTTGQSVDFVTGQPVTLRFNSYSFSSFYVPEQAFWFSDYVKLADEPFISISTSGIVSETSTALELPATYDCIALVVPSEQVAEIKISKNGGWQVAPAAVSGDYLITFISGDLERSNIISLTPTSEDYNTRVVELPKTSLNKGRYFFVELTVSGVEMPASAAFPDWVEGTF